MSTPNPRQLRKQQVRALRDAGLAARARPAPDLTGVAPTQAVWRSRDLPATAQARVGVPFSEGLSSVLVGAVAFIPVALFAGYALWTWVLAAVLTLGLSYALVSRRVVAGSDFVAVRKFGPYRLARAESIAAGALAPSGRGGVLTLLTGDGRRMRLRRVEFTEPRVNAALRQLLLASNRQYDEQVKVQLDLPWRAEFGHHRYLLDAFD